MRGDDSAETTPPPLGGRQTPSMSESPRPPPSPSPSASSSFTSSSSPNNVTPPASLPTSHSHGLPVRITIYSSCVKFTDTHMSQIV